MRTDHLPIYSRNPHMLMAIFKEIQLHYYLLLHFTYITISINHVAITDNACSLTYMCIYIPTGRFCICNLNTGCDCNR